MKTPGSCLPRVSLVGDQITGLPVTLSAEQKKDSVLILQLVHERRFTNRGAGGRGDNAHHLLIEMGVGEIRREGQVLHGGPASDGTQLRNVVVGVAVSSRAIDTREPENSPERTAHSVNAADQSFSRVVVVNRGPGTVDAGVPVGIPVVGIATAHTPSLNQLLLSSICEELITWRCEHRVRSNAEPNALVRKA